MPDAVVIQDLIDKLTLVAVLAWGVIAFVRGWVVPASIHEALRRDRDDVQKRHDRMAEIAEMALRAKVGSGL